MPNDKQLQFYAVGGSNISSDGNDSNDSSSSNNGMLDAGGRVAAANPFGSNSVAIDMNVAAFSAVNLGGNGGSNIIGGNGSSNINHGDNGGNGGGNNSGGIGFGMVKNVFSGNGSGNGNGNMSWAFELEEEEEDSNLSLIEELEIDFVDIFYKIRCVLFPFNVDRKILKEHPDFWGPLFVVIFYAFVQMWGEFDAVGWTVTFWIMGAFFVFLLARSLGCEISYSQTLGIVGYSLLPLVISVICLLFVGGSISLAVNVICTFWATYSAGSLLITEAAEKRKPMLLYPIFLLFFYFANI